MSLINDALKHAKQTQQHNPPPTPPLQLRPVAEGPSNPAPAPLGWVGLAWALILVVALGGLFVWFVAQKSARALRVTARTGSESATAATPGSPIRLAPAPARAAAGAGTNTISVATAVPAPNPPAPKLQGIAFHPTRPSAIVNGKSVVLGDRVDEFRVVAITRGRVTLVSATATNVLSLSE